LDLHTKAVHAGDRQKAPSQIPVTTPIYTAASYISGSMEELDRVMGRQAPGYSYGRYDNPTNAALEEQRGRSKTASARWRVPSGDDGLADGHCGGAGGPPPVHRAAEALYGATVGLLMNVLEPSGCEVRFRRYLRPGCGARGPGRGARLAASWRKPSPNPLLRVAEIDKLARMARGAGAALIVDNTFATPLLTRPLELGGAFFGAQRHQVPGRPRRTCWAASSSPTRSTTTPLRRLARHHRSGAGAV